MIYNVELEWEGDGLPALEFVKRELEGILEHTSFKILNIEAPLSLDHRIWFWQDDQSPMGMSMSFEAESWMQFVRELLEAPGWELAEITNGSSTRLITRRVAETVHAMQQANYLHKKVVDLDEDLIEVDIFDAYDDTALVEGAKWRLKHQHHR